MSNNCESCKYYQATEGGKGRCYAVPPDFVDQYTRNAKPSMSKWERKEVTGSDPKCTHFSVIPL